MSPTEHTDSPSTNERTLPAAVKLYYDLYLPPDAGSLPPDASHLTPGEHARAAPRPLLIALHGYGASKRQMMREARALAPAGFAIAALQGLHQHLREPMEKDAPLRFGFGWLTNFHPEDSIALHHQALRDLIAALVDESIADRRRVFLLGFSQSCALNYRFAFTEPEMLRGVVGLCGGLPGDWETSPLYRQTSAAVLHLHGTRDEFYPPTRVHNYAELLRLRANRVEVKAYEAGHELTPAMRQDVRAWLEAQAGS